jgi:hypothetical protein
MVATIWLEEDFTRLVAVTIAVSASVLWQDM